MVQVLPVNYFANSLKVIIALIVLDCMVVSSLLACSAVLVMRRQRGVDWKIIPIWLVMAAIWAWVWYYIWYLVLAITSLISGPVAMLGSVYQVICFFFMYAAICLLFATFYRLIHMTLGMTARGGRPPTALRIFHWVIMGIIVVLSVADFVIWIVFSFGIYELIRVYEAITITLDVVYWVASWEVTALAIYVFVRAMKSGSIIKKPALALLCSSTIFSVLNFMRAVDNIRWFARVWDWDDKGQYDSATATSFLEIFFCIGIYGSLLGFCLLSGHLAQRLEEGKSTDGNKPQPLGEVGSRPWSQRAALNPLVEADASHPIVEADGSNNILEMGGSKPIFEADSNQYQRHELEPTSFLGTDSSPRE